MSAGITALVCYAGVFNDVISVEEMALRLGVSGQDEFYAAVDELQRQDRIIVKEGFAGLPNFEDKIAAKAAKIAFTKKLIGSRMDRLRKIGRNALVKFVGISGSLAADNPTRDMSGRVDLDVFLVTKRHCLWIYSIIRSIRGLFPRSHEEPELCINYIMAESNLAVSNRNFYTATEIRNLIPVAELDFHRKFLQANSWACYYYPGMCDTPARPPLALPESLIDKLFYFTFVALRCVKWLSFKPLRKLSFKADPRSGESPCMARPSYGGYHALVQKKFSRLAALWFPELLDAEMIEKLFPDELSVELRRGDVDVASFLTLDYSKYG
jgi:hypothetical protein